MLQHLGHSFQGMENKIIIFFGTFENIYMLAFPIEDKLICFLQGTL